MTEQDATAEIFPRSIVLPDRATATRGTGRTGDIGLSGAQLVFFDGSVWKLVTTS